MGKALLIIILGFSFIFGSMMMNVTSNHQRSANAIVQQYEKWIARNAVESATNVANSKLFINFDWRTGFTNQSFSGVGYSVTVTDITGDSTTEAKKIEVKTIVNYENVIDTTIAIFMEPAYSYYYFFLENWPATLEYDSGDTLRGRIHVNDRIRIRDDPVFLAKVSSSDNTYQGVGPLDPKFYGGVEFGTANIVLNNSILTPLENFVASSPAADSFGIEIWVEFTGTAYNVYSDADYSILIKANNLADIKVIYSSASIHVMGTVDGQITVFTTSTDDMWIEDDMVCANDPSIDPTSDDFIGLVARHRVWLADNPANRDDLIIHAAIMSVNDEILVQDAGGSRGTLTIVGSIIEEDYHIQPATDYVLNHIPDPRLIDKTPPYFPRLDRVEMVFRSD